MFDSCLSEFGCRRRQGKIQRPVRGAGKSFHDREVDIVTVSDDGCESLHRYFLTGGVDFLMDERAETRIFYLRIDK